MNLSSWFFRTSSLAVPPPHFSLHVHSRGCLTRSELALRLHSFRSFSTECVLSSPLLNSSGHCTILRSGRNPLSLSRGLSSLARTLKFRILRCLTRPQVPIHVSAGALPLSFPTASVVSITVTATIYLLRDSIRLWARSSFFERARRRT